jgi:threonine dehydrogenase-like Zn-dependent dehydrogenase
MEVAAPNRTGTTRSAVFTGPHEVSFERLVVREPGPGQVRVRIHGSGVCGSDLPVWEGRSWFDYPREPGAPGHEGWGAVDAIGDGVDGVEVGLPVASLGSHAYAEHDVVDADAIIALPPALEGANFPGEALGCAVNVAHRSAIAPGQLVAVVGSGFLGSVIIQLAVRAGARVVAISRRGSALELAQAMGAQHAIALHDDPVARIHELTNGEGCDCVIEAAGRQATLDLAGELTRVRGRLAIAGYHQDGRRTVDLQMWNWRGLDVINAHERERAVYAAGVREAAQLVAAGQLDPSPLYTHRFRLDRLADAFTAASERPGGFMKALVLL